MGVKEEKRKKGWKEEREGGKEGGQKGRREGENDGRREGGREGGGDGKEELAKDHLAFHRNLLGTMEAERTTERFQ